MPGLEFYSSLTVTITVIITDCCSCLCLPCFLVESQSPEDKASIVDMDG
jgi:hypothetical protein